MKIVDYMLVEGQLRINQLMEKGQGGWEVYGPPLKSEYTSTIYQVMVRYSDEDEFITEEKALKQVRREMDNLRALEQAKIQLGYYPFVEGLAPKSVEKTGKK